ncbi:hypothetical protein [Ostreiculturibacter nitratireducens]|uniref:hypothetical protein n=1 Tax=Ostreiculturibacter nitratireducens TaxID=3075226 RepID=UPI0031B60EEC
MSLDNALSTARQAVEGCDFVGYVDLELGMMLGFNASEEPSQDFTENLAAGVVNFLDSGPAVQIESDLRSATGTEAELAPYFQDIVVGGTDGLHLYLRLESEPNHVVCFVCGFAADPAGALHAARAAVAEFSGLV